MFFFGLVGDYFLAVVPNQGATIARFIKRRNPERQIFWKTEDRGV
jgi:hypothetical protein